MERTGTRSFERPDADGIWALGVRLSDAVWGDALVCYSVRSHVRDPSHAMCPDSLNYLFIGIIWSRQVGHGKLFEVLGVEDARHLGSKPLFQRSFAL